MSRQEIVDVNNYINSTLGVTPTSKPEAVTYSTDLKGSIQLLTDKGFSPYSKSSPIDSALYEVFDRFVQVSGANFSADQLKDSFLDQNPSVENALNLYDKLDNTFSPQRSNEKAAIVDFLNARIDDFLQTQDSDGDQKLTWQESKMNPWQFIEYESDDDQKLNRSELRKGIYNDSPRLNSILDYFRGNNGMLVDTYS
ncbi:MAG: hypothetical protein GY765_36285 [bacterium]|nr:hypothetical protein [bacterium]